MSPRPALIVRASRAVAYKTICLYACNDDAQLTWKAVGLLLYLVSRPPRWTLRGSELVTRHRDGKDAVATGLQELEARGYLRRYQRRAIDGTLQEPVWAVSELPVRDEAGWGRILADSEVEGDLVLMTKATGSGFSGSGKPATSS